MYHTVVTLNLLIPLKSQKSKPEKENKKIGIMALKFTSHSGSDKQLCKDSYDIISNLPPYVTQCILECLPLHHAVRTSVLSRYWRYQWVQLSQIILDEKFFDAVLKRFEMGSVEASHAFSNIISNILFRHIGPIDKFALYIPSWLPSNADISHWLQFVSRNGIKKFALVNSRSMPQKLPSCLTSFIGLTDLRLYSCCFIYLPSTFKGFPCLTSMQWRTSNRELHFSEAKMLENLISLCSRLKYLNLFIMGGINLRISAPALQDLVVKGLLSSLSLKAATNLKRLSLNVLLTQVCELERDMREFFSCLFCCEKLVLDKLFSPSMGKYEGYCELETPEKLGKELECLQTLELLDVPLNCNFAVSYVLCLFRSSPHLKRLCIISAPSCRNCHGKLVQIKKSCILKCLKNVEFVLNGSKDLNLIKFLLVCSPSLEVMTIVFPENSSAEEKLEVAKELMRCGRASSSVGIIFKP